MKKRNAFLAGIVLFLASCAGRAATIESFPGDEAFWKELIARNAEESSSRKLVVDTAFQLSDTDGDGIPDEADIDVDGDGLVNWQDSAPFNSFVSRDTDGDGLDDLVDRDIDGDASLNTEDEDSDGDGNPDRFEARIRRLLQALFLLKKPVLREVLFAASEFRGDPDEDGNYEEEDIFNVGATLHEEPIRTAPAPCGGESVIYVTQVGIDQDDSDLMRTMVHGALEVYRLTLRREKKSKSPAKMYEGKGWCAVFPSRPGHGRV